MTRARTLLAVAAALLGSVVTVTSCRGEGPAAETRLLVLDGIEITLAEVEPYVAFLDSYLPEGGRKTKIQRVLEDHVIPLRLAQRMFPEERRRQRESADALYAVAKNVAELEQQSALMRQKKRSEPTRTHVALPVGMFAFDPLHVGAVSPPLELPHGWVLAGVYELRQSPGLVVQDYVDLLQVGFLTHESPAWIELYRAEQQRLADKATFVHPDYVHAMPPWLRIHQ